MTAHGEPGARGPRGSAADEPNGGGQVVGLGASAGGLAAFEAFFAGWPAEVSPQMTFVLVQHMDPHRPSLLKELIQRRTHLDVCEVEDGMDVAPNRVYIVPPGRKLVLDRGRLRLGEPEGGRGPSLPIDAFFRSLAEEERERAIGVVLSGTGSDGTEGARALKELGGRVLAQDPASAEHAGMPSSVIAEGLADAVLPAGDMGAWLMHHAGSRSRDRASSPTIPRNAADAKALEEIFRMLRTETGHDFSQYKESSVLRRLERRLREQQVESLSEYARYLRQAPEELDGLFQDLLIGVTQFFRDPAAFAALAEEGIPRLVADRLPGSVLRVWVPACSTGEEAYSIAIVLQEYLANADLSLRLQIFATDIDPRAIEVARGGVYPASIAEDLTPGRLDRFFTRVEETDSWRIRKEVRELLVFSEQDLIVDPPFSRIDLISCRNLLIYLSPELQRKLISVFHYALNAGGVLLLGTSETVGPAMDRFEALQRSAKLYVKKEAPGGGARPVTLARHIGGLRVDAGRRAPPRPATPRRPLRDLVEQELLAHDVPAAVLVDARGEILYVHGRTGAFLEPATGEVAMNILSMAREGLKRGLTNALHRATSTEERVLQSRLRVRSNGNVVAASLSVRRVSHPGLEDWGGPLFLVTLEEHPATEDERGSQDASGVQGGEPDGDAASRIAELEEELSASETYLTSLEDRMQESGEAFRATIEELQSTNEELQSTNEELETSKEELQSMTEELTTINSELETKVAELSRVENDMSNLLAGTGIGTVFVDHDLRIQRFTPAATELLNLIPGDVGRPVSDLTSRLEGYDELARDAQGVLDTLVGRDIEVRTKEGAWHLLRIRPYRTFENVIEGAVFTFTDISEVKEARATLRESEALQRLAVVVKDARDAITVQDLTGRLTAWNPGAGRLYGWSESEALGMSYLDLVLPDDREEVRGMLGRVADGAMLDPVRSIRVGRDGGRLTVWVVLTALLDADEGVYAIASTEWRAAEDRQQSGGA